MSIGYKENEIVKPEDMLTYYLIEDIEEYGVLSIKVKVI